MADLISRAAAMRAFSGKPGEYCHPRYIVGELKDLPAVDAVPVEWLMKKREHCKTTWDIDFYEAVQIILGEWQKEQEANGA